ATRFMKTWIKFCGTTSLHDAMASVEAGANALGFIFAPSKRRITVERAQAIIRELPAGVERIGVFLDATSKEIQGAVIEADLTGIQLHREQSVVEPYNSLFPECWKSLRIIRTVLVNDEFTTRLDGTMAADDAVDAWLLDSGAGSGNTFDWQAAHAQLGE